MVPPITSGADFVWALIAQSDSSLLEAELAEALRYQLAPRRPTARELRLCDLWLLRELIGAAGGVFPQRLDYEASRSSTEALSGHSIVQRYGTWWEACAIAARMEADGKLPRGRTFSGGRLTRGRDAIAQYTVEEVVSAVRLCAVSHGRRPTSQDYYDWSAEQRRIGREQRIDKRVPSKMALAKLFPGPRRWERTLAACAITDAELQHARAALLRCPSGGDDESPFLALPISEAVALAIELQGSLDWLAGRTIEQTGVPEPGLRFSPERFRELRDGSLVAATKLSQVGGLTTGQSRRLLTGTFEPTLGMVVTLASLLGVAVADLCESRRR